MKTVTLGLNDFVGFMETTDWGATFAAITVTVLPTFLFISLRISTCSSGLTAGAVKGYLLYACGQEREENHENLLSASKHPGLAIALWKG